MKTKTVVSDPNPILRKVASEYDFSNDASILNKMLNKLLFACKINNGVGIAAQQVGLTDAMFIFNNKIAINPKITYRSDTIEHDYEGCLSTKDLVSVPRSTHIEVLYHDRTGKAVEAKLEGLEARIFQHEYDHLLGKLIYDYR